MAIRRSLLVVGDESSELGPNWRKVGGEIKRRGGGLPFGGRGRHYPPPITAKNAAAKHRTAAMTLMIPVSWGEVMDKITILEIKAGRIADPAKQANVARELTALQAAVAAAGGLSDAARPPTIELAAVNAELWDIEDAVRHCERAGDFGPDFIALARRVYHVNDRRAALKRRINLATGSELVEEKSYAFYGNG
jgi:hypothetical protein